MSSRVDPVANYLFTVSEEEGMNESVFLAALAHLTPEDTPLFKKFFGMDPDTFHRLLMTVGPRLRQDEHGPGLKLQVALRHFVSRPSTKVLAAAWTISPSAVPPIINEVTKAMMEEFLPIATNLMFVMDGCLVFGVPVRGAGETG